MLVADRAGHIAIRSTGVFPIRAGDGRGDVIRDGARTANDWLGSWPIARYPGAVDPTQGFLASANQQPIDPNVDPGYLGTDWFPPWRAMRINELLRKGQAATPDLMRRYQTDPGSARADVFVPVLMRAARLRPARAMCVRSATLIGEWDRRYTRDNRRAVLFEAAMRMLPRLLWDELRPNDARGGSIPSDQIVAELTADSSSAWWDDRRTPGVEHRDDLLCEALEQGLSETIRLHGQPDDIRWSWDHVRFANIRHLLRLPALSALEIPIQGGPSTLNPSSGNGAYGASWRMVAELGPEIRAWGTYPGGQSGNPLSTRYLDRLPLWKAGTLDTLRFPRRPEDLAGTRVRSWLALLPTRR
jgi:penicillin amidase